VKLLEGQLFVMELVSLLSGSVTDEYSASSSALLLEVFHPNVLRYIEHFVEGCTLIFVTEHAGGRWLQDVLRPSSALAPHQEPREQENATRLAPLLPEPECLRIARAVCETLVGLHGGAPGRGPLCHGAVCPDNVLLTEDGGIKLAGFGLAAVLEGVVAGSGGVGPAPSSPSGCAAPEVLAFGPPCDAASDVWSLGALTYAALTGQPLVRSRAEARELVAAHFGAPPSWAFPRAQLTGLGASASAVDAIQAILWVDRSHRPSAAEALKLLDYISTAPAAATSAAAGSGATAVPLAASSSSTSSTQPVPSSIVEVPAKPDRAVTSGTAEVSPCDEIRMRVFTWQLQGDISSKHMAQVICG
jgi:serine/threonine protein kinase